MLRRNPSRYIEPEEVISALRQAFGEEYTVGPPERMISLINEAFHPTLKPSNHVVRAMLMWRALGFTREDLIRALYAKPEPYREINPYVDQKVESTCGYRTDLTKLTGFHKLAWLRTRLKFKDFADPRRDLEYVDGLEQNAIVLPGAFARFHGISDPYGAGYRPLLRKLAERLNEVMKRYGHDFWSSALEDLPFERLELHPLAQSAFERLEKVAPDDYACFPAQFGQRWRGSSMERAAWYLEHTDAKVAFVRREFPLPAYAVLCELIVNPNRLVGKDILAIDCPGDVVTDYRGEYFRGGLTFVFRDKRLHLTVRPRQAADERCGSATGLY